MDSPRTKLVVGFGISVVSVLVAYAVYRTLRPSKETKQPPQNPRPKPKEVRFEDVDPDEFPLNPPVAASSECNLLDRVAEESREQSFNDSIVTEELVDTIEAPQEETIVPYAADQCSSSPHPVDLDETVTLNSSDLSSSSLVEVESSFGSDDASKVESIPLDDSDIIEIIPYAEANIQSVCNPTVSANYSQQDPVAVEDIQVATSVDTTSSAPPTPIKDSDVIEVSPPVLASSSSTQNALEDLESSMQPCNVDDAENVSITSDTIVSKSAEILNEELSAINESFHSVGKDPPTKTTSVDKETVPAGLSEEPIANGYADDSATSSDSVNGNRSITADSGIGLSSRTTNMATDINGDESKCKERRLNGGSVSPSLVSSQEVKCYAYIEY